MPVHMRLQDFRFRFSRTTVWAMAIELIALRRDTTLRVVFYILAFLVSLSRVYLGVHYP